MKFFLVSLLFFTHYSFSEDKKCDDWLLVASYANEEVQEQRSDSKRVHIQAMDYLAEAKKNEAQAQNEKDKKSAEDFKAQAQRLQEYADNYLDLAVKLQNQMQEYQRLSEKDPSCEKLDYNKFASEYEEKALFFAVNAIVYNEMAKDYQSEAKKYQEVDNMEMVISYEMRMFQARAGASEAQAKAGQYKSRAELFRQRAESQTPVKSKTPSQKEEKEWDI